MKKQYTREWSCNPDDEARDAKDNPNNHHTYKRRVVSHMARVCCAEARRMGYTGDLSTMMVEDYGDYGSVTITAYRNPSMAKATY